MPTPPKVFISATTDDLRHVREMVRDVLLTMGCMPIVEEHFSFDYREISEMLRTKIKVCDAMIQIVGMRYGGEPGQASRPEKQPRRSYTQMELDIAHEVGLKKVFTFVCGEGFPYLTEDKKRKPLPDEPPELVDLQAKYRERILCQKEIYYEVDRPNQISNRVRELQLELTELKRRIANDRRQTAAIGFGILVALMAVGFSISWLATQGGIIADKQEGIEKRLDLQQQTPRVLSAYQERFREIRNNPNRETTLPNALIDEMVRAELPKIVGLQDEQVREILEIEAPRLAGETDTPINLKLKSLFVMGEYDATLEQGQKLIVSLSIKGLQTMGDAALAKFDEEPSKKLRDDAVRYYQGSLALIEKESSPEDWANAANMTAIVLHDVGRYDKALRLYREALETREKVLGHDHLDTLSSINNLASMLTDQGNYDQALPLYREALQKRESVLGRNHPDTLTSINNLASLLQDQGNYDEARPLYQEAQETSKKVLGHDHPSTLISISNLASLVHAQGNYDDALLLYRKALETSEKALGRDHPDTLSIINNLAFLLQTQSNHDEAFPLFRRALETREHALGRDHPDTLISIGNLASLLQAKGNYDEALPLYREVQETSQKVLGRDHPFTLSIINNLASLLQDQGNHDDALLLYRMALETSEKVLGRDHPNTLGSIDNLAGLLSDQRNYDQALPLYREALQKRESVLGRNHPDTLTSINNFASMLADQGNYEEALPLLREVLETSEQVLGRNHPDTLISIGNLASLLKDQGNFGEASPLFREAYEGFAAKLSETHPNTKTFKENWERCQAEMQKSQ